MDESRIRERAYFIWELEGRPEGEADHHWARATIEERQRSVEPEEEKLLAGRTDVNMPALLTKDVKGG